MDLVTRVGRCSDEVIPLEAAAFAVLALARVTGATPSAGNTSSSSSSSESLAARFAMGVFRG